MEHMFQHLEYIFQRLKYMFQQLKQNFYHREKTFIALSCNNLSTMFQDCSNSAAFCALNLPFRVFTEVWYLATEALNWVSLNESGNNNFSYNSISQFEILLYRRTPKGHPDHTLYI